MRRDNVISRRVTQLEDHSGGGVETGIRVVEAEELARWWAEEWDGTLPPTQGQGVAEMSPEIPLAEWEQKFGVVEIDVDHEEHEK